MENKQNFKGFESPILCNCNYRDRWQIIHSILYNIEQNLYIILYHIYHIMNYYKHPVL